MSRKKKNYHKKNKGAKNTQEEVKTKSSLNLYILIGMTIIGAFSIIYLSSR
jgi:hypothetical protein